MANATGGQKCARPGVASSFANFDSRTSTPTGGPSAGIAGSPTGSLMGPKGNSGVLGDGSDSSYVKSGGNPTGGSGGTACQLPTFTPPTTSNRSLETDEPWVSGGDHDRLWSYYQAPDRGQNLFRYTDGTYELTDAWPTVTDGVGHVVDRAFYGAHSYTVTAGEAAAITTYLASIGIVANIV